MGRLGDAVSPYLRSHASQPIDWFPWGSEAFEEAARRDVPVMISIGYHTCHWCHVMSRECFSDPDIARVINDTVVAIKVDREEHPDVDAVYMAQAQAFTENLGWPLTVFATPDGHAFYAATYLPPVASGGLPSLVEVVRAVSSAWHQKRSEVQESSKALIDALKAHSMETQGTGALPGHDHLAVVVEALVAAEDSEYGGFGTQPKFPVAPIVTFLGDQAAAGNTGAGLLATRLLETYRCSPLLDAVEGGFFRYATKQDFSEPHYERMLTDNAGLLSAYSRAGMNDTAAGIVRFLREQLLTHGALGSGRDSESIIDGVSHEGGYFQLSANERAGLPAPALDDKIISAWNGLALEALAHAHRADVAGEPGKLGEALADWLIAHHLRPDGSVIRVSRAGIESDAVATSEDYGGLALGLCEMGMALGSAHLVAHAKALIDRVMTSPETVGSDPVLQAKGLPVAGDINEGASPSGPSLLALASLRLARLTGNQSYRDFAIAQISPHVAHAMLTPLGSGGVLRVLSELASPSREVVVVADSNTELAGIAKRWQGSGGVSIVVDSRAAKEFVAAGFSLFEGRTNGETPLAYVCEGGVCRLPVTTASQLQEQLAR
jgi:uncharacterized protein